MNVKSFLRELIKDGSGQAMPGIKVVNIDNSAPTYVAPADGYAQFSCRATALRFQAACRTSGGILTPLPRTDTFTSTRRWLKAHSSRSTALSALRASSTQSRREASSPFAREKQFDTPFISLKAALSHSFPQKQASNNSFMEVAA